MKHADFETFLKQSLHKIPAGKTEHDLDSMIVPARLEVSRRQKRKRIPFQSFLYHQIRYIGWPLWSAQGLLLLLFDRMLIQLYGERFWDSPSSAARLLFCFSTLVAMMALPLLYRSRTYRMQEIESASYFSSVKLLMAKLAVIGMGDIFLLAGMFLMTMIRTSMYAGNLLLCLILPFLFISGAYLYMMGHCSGSGFLAGSLSLGASMIFIAVALPGRWIPVFQQSIPIGLAFFCLGLLAFSAEQLRYLLRHSPYAELQIT